MADNTKIEWTDATWNPITGCSVVSPGCTNCYAMKLAGTRLKHHPSRAGLTRDSKAGPVWTGEVRFNREWLDHPLRWRRPRMIFVCAHGDLFAEGVPDEWIDQVFAVMALSPQHTFQVLTKRPERMRTYLRDMGKALESDISTFGERWGVPASIVTGSPCAAGAIEDVAWPLPNVWLGVSVEDQKRAMERIPLLLETPAAVRWISAEPLLGPLDLTVIDVGGDSFVDALNIRTWEEEIENWRDTEPDWEASFLDWYNLAEMPEGPILPRLDWVVVGGESGPGARPMQPEWAESLRDQCAAAGVPFLFKQWGSHKQTSDCNGRYMIPATKKEAGRLLDGIEHNGFPDMCSTPAKGHDE
jgi:protein gp37